MAKSQGLARLERATTGTSASVQWSFTTLLWATVAIALPLNRALPPAPRTIWFVLILVSIAVPFFSAKPARPLYPAVWVFAAYASIVATFTATKQSTVAQNLFVGAQLVALLGFGVFSLTSCVRNDPRFAVRVAGAFLIGQSVSALAAISQVLGQQFLGVASMNGRAPGLAGHPNSLGILASVAILLALHFSVHTRKFRLLTIVALATNVLALFASGSLSSFMALGAGLLVFTFCKREHLTRLVVSGFIFLVALWGLTYYVGVFNYLPSVAKRYQQVTGQTDAESSWGFRMRTYEFAWQRVVDEPLFGTGLGSESSGTFNGITVTHNLILRGWYQGGLLLALALTIIIVSIALVAIHAIARRQHGVEAAILVAVAAFALTSAFFEQRDYWLPLLLAWASISSGFAGVRGSDRPASLQIAARPSP